MDVWDVILGLMFAICTVEDVFMRRIHLLTIAVFGAGGIIFLFAESRIHIYDAVAGACVGLFIIVLSVLSHGAIGAGDGLVLMVSGIYIGMWDNLILLWVAVLIAGAAGLIKRCMLHTGKKDTMPFAPMLMTSYIILRTSGMGG